MVGIYRDQNDARSIPMTFVLSLLLIVPLTAQAKCFRGIRTGLGGCR